MVRNKGISRRAMLGMGVGILGGPAIVGRSLFSSSAGADERARVKPSGRPKNIIFMIADGMSTGVISLAEPFSQFVRGSGTHWFALQQSPQTIHGFFETHSLSSMVTDSAAASTAWSSGSRVFNGAINVLPDGTKLTPIGQLAKQTGRRVGLVTTTTITHATPAGFAAVHPDRSAQHDIATQYDGVVDILMGGGREFFDPERRVDGLDLVEKYKAAGYDFCDRRDQLLSSGKKRKLLGLFWEGHLPYTLDWRHQSKMERAVPTLAEMTRKALGSLKDSDKGFLLQVEGGRVDHAAHANDAAAIMWDQLAFDDAVGVVLDFVKDRDDTLVVVTSDHGNANPGLNGMGGKYKKSDECFERLAQATASYDYIIPRLRSEAKEDGGISREAVIETIKSMAGIELAKEDADLIAAASKGRLPQDHNHQHSNFVGLLGQLLGNHTGIGWTGVTHTADWVVISAVGPGAEHFRGLVRNTDAFRLMTSLWEIDHRNPAMSRKLAKPYLAAILDEEAHTLAHV